MNVYEEVKKALQDIVAPELKALQGEIKALNTEIKRLDEKIDFHYKNLDEKIDQRFDSLRNELISEIKRVDCSIEGLDRELQTAINIRERLAALEAKMGS
jgi:predicted  nucleic acid-binding Zn-ribbon protein